MATHFVDAGSPAQGNWLRYVNCARNEQEENLNVVFCEDLVFYLTSKDIAPNTELLMWYGNWYGNFLGIKRVHPGEGYSFLRAAKMMYMYKSKCLVKFCQMCTILIRSTVSLINKQMTIWTLMT